jgi:solute carrier family 35 protein E3
MNHAVSVPRFVISLIAALLIERFGQESIFSDDFHMVETMLILLTGCLAVIGDCVGFSLIGRTGAIPFQVIGHAATITGFVPEVWVFSRGTRVETTLKLAGFGTSVVAVIVYTAQEMRNRALEVQSRAVLDERDLLSQLDLVSIRGGM